MNSFLQNAPRDELSLRDATPIQIGVIGAPGLKQMGQREGGLFMFLDNLYNSVGD